MSSNFPIFPTGTIFRPFSGCVCGPFTLKFHSVQVDYPVRLNGMTIDSANIALEKRTSFPAGEICFSIDKFVHAKVEATDAGKITITNDTERKAIVLHACLLMCAALNLKPSFNISVHLDSGIQKHSGLGSSGAIMASVCSAINELYGKPINKLDLLKYMADNYGEEVDDSDEERLKLVQCVGGSVGNGLTENGITIITGNATPIFSQNYDAKILIAIPKDFRPGSAKEMMELEENNLNKFVSHGQKYAREIAYNLIHDGMPKLASGDISSICQIIYRHRFEMGSIRNCSFIYPKIMDVAGALKYLYEENYCRLVSMSSVGPALFIILDDDPDHEKKCIEAMNEQGLAIITSSIYNKMYAVVRYRKENYETD